MSKQHKSQSHPRVPRTSASSLPTEHRPPDAKVGFAEAEAQREAFLARLVRMSTEERRRAARYGGFTSWQRSFWAAHFPAEVPVVNGEYEWIALTLADLD
jgi:hypothetical protein